MNEQPESYEAALNELQTIRNELEQSEVTVDQLADKVRRANFLVKYCQEKLRKTEQEINEVLEESEV